MKVALHDSDATGFPNLALMKLAAWHKRNGDVVERFQPLFRNMYDRIYSSKVFTFTPSDQMLPASVVRGGTGYGMFDPLPDEVEHIMPDYAMFGVDHAMGFTTRGCPNACPWCVVPRKEGKIADHADIEEFMGGGMRSLVLMDNNILASEHGLRQLGKVATMGAELDCNQGLDARLVDGPVAKLLASIRWKRMRFACDRSSQMPAVERAVRLVRAAGGKKIFGDRIFVYVLVRDIEDALERIEFLRALDVDCFAQPYRDFVSGQEPTQEQKDFARWCNHKAIFRTVPWAKYRGRKAA